MTFKEIQKYEDLVNQKFQQAESSNSDDDWVKWNSMWTKLGEKIRSYGGAKCYNREKTINILINEIDNEEK